MMMLLCILHLFKSVFQFIALDKALFFSTKKYLYFSYFLMKTYVVGTY